MKKRKKSESSKKKLARKRIKTVARSKIEKGEPIEGSSVLTEMKTLKQYLGDLEKTIKNGNKANEALTLIEEACDSLKFIENSILKNRSH